MRNRRTLAPSPPVKARYPRLAAAWRLLAAPILLSPSLAHADTSVPTPGQSDRPSPAPPPKQVPTVKGKRKAPDPPSPPQVAPKPKRPTEDPRIEGLMGQISRPEAPTVNELSLFHPHAPNEPCWISGGDDDA